MFCLSLQGIHSQMQCTRSSDDNYQMRRLNQYLTSEPVRDKLPSVAKLTPGEWCEVCGPASHPTKSTGSVWIYPHVASLVTWKDAMDQRHINLCRFLEEYKIWGLPDNTLCPCKTGSITEIYTPGPVLNVKSFLQLLPHISSHSQVFPPLLWWVNFLV